MQTNYSNFEQSRRGLRPGLRQASLPRILCMSAGAFLAAGSASAQFITDPIQVVNCEMAAGEDLTPGGGAGPGKIDHGTLTGSAVAKHGSFGQIQPCAADVNADGEVGIDDLFDFFVYFDAGDIRADLVGDRLLSLDDLIIFLEAFDQGC